MASNFFPCQLYVRKSPQTCSTFFESPQRWVKSNAILLVKDGVTVGVGGGQVSRVDAVDVAINKSGDNISESIFCT